MSHLHVAAEEDKSKKKMPGKTTTQKAGGEEEEAGQREQLQQLTHLLQVRDHHQKKQTSEEEEEEDSGASSPAPATPTPCSSSSSSAGASMDDFDVLRVLGKGAYGKVFQARKRRGRDAGVIYAIKSVSKARIGDSRTDLRHTRTERDVLARVRHPFLVRIHYAFETPHRLYFVQEFMRGGELFRLMETERLLVEPEARFYLCEIALALEYLHSLNIVYRDLKTENIMLDAEGHIKLIDFGLSKMLGSDEQLTMTFCGTVEYMAPEVVMRAPGHGLTADWWSFGVFAFDLLTGRSPFHSVKGKKETKERILRGKFSVPAFLTHEACDLIRRLLRRSVERRLGGGPGGAAEVKAHAFFSAVNWDRVQRRDYDPPHVPGFRNAGDPTDVSQFDPRFTTSSPRQSECKGGAEEADRAGRCCPYSKMFGDFDYVADHDEEEEEEEGEELSESDSTSDDSGVKEEEEEAASVEMAGLSIRDHGD